MNIHAIHIRAGFHLKFSYSTEKWKIIEGFHSAVKKKLNFSKFYSEFELFMEYIFLKKMVVKDYSDSFKTIIKPFQMFYRVCRISHQILISNLWAFSIFYGDSLFYKVCLWLWSKIH